jgi:hypothetical protein
MSFELDYFPPRKCGKYKWHHKTMSYGCWSCRISEQLKEAKVPNIRDIFPLSISGKVDISEGRYWWRVTATDWEYRHSEAKGWADTAEEAICKAEEVGERYWDQLVEDWMVEALKNRWRPPCPEVRVYGTPPETFTLSLTH